MKAHLGTLLGPCFIAVIENGMNLTGVDSDMQMVVLDWLSSAQ